MKKPLELLICLGVAFGLSLPVSASTIPPNVLSDFYYPSLENGIPTPRDNNDGIPDIRDAINMLYGLSSNDPGYLERNYDADPYYVSQDSIWSDLEGVVALIGLTAGYQNSLGIYTDLAIGLQTTEVIPPHSGYGFAGSGTFIDPFEGSLLNLMPGVPFGWYLHANQQTMYFSEDALNPAGWDHMQTYALGALQLYVDLGNSMPEAINFDNAYLLAWEDLPWNGNTLGDDDYDDMLFLVAKASPTTVPEPSTGLLFGSGFFSILLLRRRAKGRAFSMP